MSVGRRAAQIVGVSVAGYLTYSAIRMTVGSRRTVASLRQVDEHIADPGAESRFLLLLPMLREDETVGPALRGFLPVVDARRRMDVVLATSRSETIQRDEAVAALTRGEDPSERHIQLAVTPEKHAAAAAALRAGDLGTVRALVAEHRRPTTAELAAPIIAELNRKVGRSAFRLVDVADEQGTKVEKMNFAVDEWLRSAEDPDPGAYVAVYDADSAPELRTFAMVEQELAARGADGRPAPEIFQQVSCYCRNLRRLTGVRGLFSLADAVAQTRWALGFEYPLFRRYARQVRTGGIRPLVYCVGHGCFVSVGFLKRIGGFPSVSATDDLALGYLASALGAEVTPVPALDYCEVAQDPVQSMRQSRFWFSGSARFWRDLSYARDTFDTAVPAAQWAALHADGFGRNAAWAGRGLAWVGALGLAAATRQWRLAGVVALSHVIYVQGGYVQTVRALRQLPGADERTGLSEIPTWRRVAAGFAASGAFVLRSLGPLVGALESRRGRMRTTWRRER
jgi:hypothetical protein